jgi:hypothetical protein
MDPAPENIRTADEVSGIPVSERELATRGRVIKYTNPAALDEVDALGRRTLAEHRLAAIDHALPAVAEH